MPEQFRGEFSSERNPERGPESGSSSGTDRPERLVIEVTIDAEDPNWHLFAVNIAQINAFTAVEIEYEIDNDMDDVIFAVLDDEQRFGVLFDATREDITEPWLDVIYTIGVKLGYTLATIDILIVGDPERRVVSLNEVFQDFSDDGLLLPFPK